MISITVSLLIVGVFIVMGVGALDELFGIFPRSGDGDLKKIDSDRP